MRVARSPAPHTTIGSESPMPNMTSMRSPWAVAAMASTLSRLIVTSATMMIQIASQRDEPRRTSLPASDAGSEVRRGSSLWEAIWIIIVADVTMSLDNVLAIAATAHGDLMLVMFGIGLSLPIVVWGAGLLATLMNRYAWIVWLGGGLLGYVAGEMVIEDPILTRWLGSTAPVLQLAVPIALGVVVTAIGWWLGRGHHHVHVPEKL